MVGVSFAPTARDAGALVAVGVLWPIAARPRLLWMLVILVRGARAADAFGVRMLLRDD